MHLMQSAMFVWCLVCKQRTSRQKHIIHCIRLGWHHRSVYVCVFAFISFVYCVANHSRWREFQKIFFNLNKWFYISFKRMQRKFPLECTYKLFVWFTLMLSFLRIPCSWFSTKPACVIPIVYTNLFFWNRFEFLPLSLNYKRGHQFFHYRCCCCCFLILKIIWLTLFEVLYSIYIYLPLSFTSFLW